jgi:hypothetical protein
VRQELLTPIKPYLQSHYQSYDGVADLYTYFYEKGVQILKPDGILCYIVTNKWLRSGYGEALRRFFTQNSIFEKIIDFGHAPIFKEADVFPCIVSLRKRSPSIPLKKGEEENSSSFSGEENSPSFAMVAEEENSPPFARGAGGDLFVQICSVPREECLNANLTQYVSQNSFPVVWSRFSEKAWSLEPPAVEDLMQKIKQVGIALKDFAGVKPYRGILTGFNEAFLIDNDTKQKLVQADPKCAEIIKPYLRGSDIKRWHPEWAELWIILMKSSANHEWVWSSEKTEEEAEKVLAQTYPSLYKHLKPYESNLRKRQDQGRFWWELRACVYYDIFEKPKIITQDLATHSWFSYSDSNFYPVNTCYIWSVSDLYLLGWMCSPIAWWIFHRELQHSINNTLRMFRDQVELLPIPQPTPKIRTEVEEIVSRLIEITKRNQENNREVGKWIQSTHKIPKLGQKLENFALLSQIEFIETIRQRIPKTSGGLSPKGLKEVENVYQEYALPMQSDRAESNRLEHRLSDLINQAYQLTPTEIELMWRTAPPRMPISQP